MVRVKEEIHILPSNIETIDFALFDHVNDSFDLHTNTNEAGTRFRSSGSPPSAHIRLNMTRECEISKAH